MRGDSERSSLTGWIENYSAVLLFTKPCNCSGNVPSVETATSGLSPNGALRRANTSEHRTTGQRDLVRELYRTIYEQQSFDAVPDFYAPDAVRHGGLRGNVEDHEALQEHLTATLGGLF